MTIFSVIWKQNSMAPGQCLHVTKTLFGLSPDYRIMRWVTEPVAGEAVKSIDLLPEVGLYVQIMCLTRFP